MSPSLTYTSLTYLFYTVEYPTCTKDNSSLQWELRLATSSSESYTVVKANRKQGKWYGDSETLYHN